MDALQSLDCNFLAAQRIHGCTKVSCAIILYHVCPRHLEILDYIAEIAATPKVCKNVTLFLDASGFPYPIKANDSNPEVGLSILGSDQIGLSICLSDEVGLSFSLSDQVGL